jgi:hypothetical protein
VTKRNSEIWKVLREVDIPRGKRKYPYKAAWSDFERTLKKLELMEGDSFFIAHPYTFI